MRNHDDPMRRLVPARGQLCVAKLRVECETHDHHDVWVVSADGNAAWLVADVLAQVLGWFGLESELTVADPDSFGPWRNDPGRGGRG